MDLSLSCLVCDCNAPPRLATGSLQCPGVAKASYAAVSLLPQPLTLLNCTAELLVR